MRKVPRDSYYVRANVQYHAELVKTSTLLSPGLIVVDHIFHPVEFLRRVELMFRMTRLPHTKTVRPTMRGMLGLDVSFCLTKVYCLYIYCLYTLLGVSSLANLYAISLLPRKDWLEYFVRLLPFGEI